MDGNHPLIQREAMLFQKKEDFVTLHQGREWALFDGYFVLLATKIPLLKVRCSLMACIPFNKKKKKNASCLYLSISLID